MHLHLLLHLLLHLHLVYQIDERVDPGKALADDPKDENDEGMEDVEEDNLAEEEDPDQSLKVESPNT